MTKRKKMATTSTSTSFNIPNDPIYIPISDTSFAVYDEPQITISKSFYNIIKNNITNNITAHRNGICLYSLRFFIRRAKKVDDLIQILKFMASKYNCLSGDDLTELLVNCFKKYPVTDLELQQFSIWQQQYDSDYTGGIYNYVTIVFWTCIIYAIQEREESLLSNPNNANNANNKITTECPRA